MDTGYGTYAIRSNEQHVMLLLWKHKLPVIKIIPRIIIPEIESLVLKIDLV